MFCNYCGSPNPEDFVYCSSCGRGRKPAGYSEPQREASPLAKPAKNSLTRAKAYLRFWLYWLGAWLLIGFSLWLVQPLFDVKGDGVETLVRISGTLSLTVWSWLAWILAGRKVTPRDRAAAASSSRYARWTTNALYAGLVSGLFLAGSGLLGFALTIFDTCAGVSTEAPIEKTNTFHYSPLPLLFLGLLLVNRMWREILRRQPHAAYGKRHKQIRIGIAIGIFAVPLVFGVFGHYAGRERIRALKERVAALRPASDRFKAELSRIRSAEVSTFEDYHKNCLRLEALLDEYDPIRKQSAAVIAEYARVARDRPATRGIADLLTSIHETDDRIMSLLRDEISHSKKLVEQPPRKREAYYNRYVGPIQAELARLAEEEARLLKQAEQRGMKSALAPPQR